MDLELILRLSQAFEELGEDDEVKVIVLTGTEDPMAPQESANVGADAFFSKPFSPLALIRKIEELLG